jgi:hypothetical protein
MVRGHNHFSRHHWIDPAFHFAAALIALIIKGLRNKMSGHIAIFSRAVRKAGGT